MRQLKADGIVRHQVPAKVEQALTNWGEALCLALDALLTWAALRNAGAQPVDEAQL